TRLRILSADGQVRIDRTLVEVIPPRTLNQASAIVASGISFTADGRSLYVVMIDQGTVYQRSRLVRFDVATGDQTLVAGDLGGPGGAISPDGTRFVFPRPDGDRHDLAVLDVATG